MSRYVYRIDANQNVEIRLADDAIPYGWAPLPLDVNPLGYVAVVDGQLINLEPETVDAGSIPTAG